MVVFITIELKKYNLEIHVKKIVSILLAIFLALWVWEVTRAIQDDKYLKCLEGMTIFGRDDTNMEGMTIIWKE